MYLEDLYNKTFFPLKTRKHEKVEERSKASIVCYIKKTTGVSSSFFKCIFKIVLSFYSNVVLSHAFIYFFSLDVLPQSFPHVVNLLFLLYLVMGLPRWC